MSLQREASNDEGEANGAEAVALEEGHEVAEADKHHDRHADIRVIEGDGKVVPVLGLRCEGVRESSCVREGSTSIVLAAGCENRGQGAHTTIVRGLRCSRLVVRVWFCGSPQPPGGPVAWLRRTRGVELSCPDSAQTLIGCAVL